MKEVARRDQTVPGQVTPTNRAEESLTAAITISDEELYERVARKAYELFQQRGEVPGREVDDWLVAERMVKEELLHGPVLESPILEDDDDPNDDGR